MGAVDGSHNICIMRFFPLILFLSLSPEKKKVIAGYPKSSSSGLHEAKPNVSISDRTRLLTNFERILEFR